MQEKAWRMRQAFFLLGKKGAEPFREASRQRKPHAKVGGVRREANTDVNIEKRAARQKFRHAKFKYGDRRVAARNIGSGNPGAPGATQVERYSSPRRSCCATCGTPATVTRLSSSSAR